MHSLAGGIWIAALTDPRAPIRHPTPVIAEIDWVPHIRIRHNSCVDQAQDSQSLTRRNI